MTFNPNLPITSYNHPACDHCDVGVENVPCTCFDWPTPIDDAKRIAALEAELVEERARLEKTAFLLSEAQKAVMHVSGATHPLALEICQWLAAIDAVERRVR